MTAPPTPDPAPEVIVTSRLRRDDIVEIRRWALRRGRQLKTYFGTGLIAIFLGTAVLAKHIPAERLDGELMVFAGLGLVAICSYRYIDAGQRAFERRKATPPPETLGFSAAGVWHRSPYGEGRSTWANYRTSFETDRLYVLTRRSGPGVLIVPKRDLPGGPAEAMLRGLLETFTAARLRTPPSSG